MHHVIHCVTSVAIVAPHTLLVFSDGTEQRLDFEPVLQGDELAARAALWASHGNQERAPNKTLPQTSLRWPKAAVKRVTGAARG